MSEAPQKFLALQYINHIISSPDYPKSKGFTERQIKTALDTAKSSGNPLITFSLACDQHQLGSTFPVPEKFYKNRTQDRLGQPSHPTDLEKVIAYLITQKSVQKMHHDRRYNTRDLPKLHPGQLVLFFKLSRCQFIH